MNTVSATFKTDVAAANAIRALESHGFSADEISVLMAETTLNKGFKIEEASKVPEGTAVGGVTGGILGAVLAGLTAAGTIVAPGIGLMVAGPLVAALAGGSAGAVAGGLLGSLIGLGLPEHEARLYNKDIGEGAVLVAVSVDSSERAALAKDVFKRQDAYNIAA